FREELLAIDREEADQMFAIRSGRIASAMRTLTDEGLLLRDDPAHAQVLRGNGAVGLLTANDEALLRAQHVHRLGSVRRDAERLTGCHHGFPERKAIPAGGPELVGELAGEGDPVQAHRDPTRLALADRHEWKALRVHRDSREQGVDDIPGLR